MNSGTVLAGTVGITTMANGVRINASDWRDIADEIVVELVVECRIDRVPCANNEQRVAVGRGTHDRLGGDMAAGDRTVVDDERLTEPLREPLTYQSRRDVRAASGREANNDAHRPRRIGLRPCNARDRRQRGSTGGQMQECAAGKFHFEPPSSHHSITSSAVASSVGGTVRPSSLAVARLMTSSNFDACITGRSAGLAPLRMRPA